MNSCPTTTLAHSAARSNLHCIRFGLLTPDMISSRSEARGVSEKDYMSGDLLGREVTSDDVAQAFLHHELVPKTTADVTTVDGAISRPRYGND